MNTASDRSSGDVCANGATSWLVALPLLLRLEEAEQSREKGQAKHECMQHRSVSSRHVAHHSFIHSLVHSWRHRSSGRALAGIINHSTCNANRFPLQATLKLITYLY